MEISAHLTWRLGIVCVCFLGFSKTQISNDGTQRPNVLLIIIDDLRTDLGCYGNSFLKTPNVDNLASKSILFEQAFAQQAVCGPSRTSFLTSRRPDTTRLYDFYSFWRVHAGNYTTLPQHFRENGYITQNVGKVFHPGIASNYTDDAYYSWTNTPYHPPTQAYKDAKVCPGSNGTLGMNIVCPVDVSLMPGKSLPDLQSSEFAVEFLKNMSEAKPGQPFFLAVGFHKPHIPLKYPKEYKDLYPLSEMKLAKYNTYPWRLPLVAYNPWVDLRIRDDGKSWNMNFPFGPVPDLFQIQIRQSYYAATSYMDSQVGKVLEALEQGGFAENTIVAFIGDHGWALGEHGVWTKYSLFEVTVRAPFILYIPGVTYTNNNEQVNIFPFFDVFRKQKTLHEDVHADEGVLFEERTTTSFLNVASIPKDVNTLPSDNDAQSWVLEPRYKTSALVELVDLFPTLADAAGLPSLPICPKDPFKTWLCTEGASLMPLIKNITRNTTEIDENDIYWQKYPNIAPELISLHFLALNCSDDFSAAKFDGVQWKSAVFSQYPRPSVEPQNNTELPHLVDIRIMGYSMWTADFHYTEWVKFIPINYTIVWEEVYGRELYLRSSDPYEINNVALLERCFPLVEALSKQLHIGWRGQLTNGQL